MRTNNLFLTLLISTIFLFSAKYSIEGVKEILREELPNDSIFVAQNKVDTFEVVEKFKPLPKIFFEKAGKSIVSKHQVFTLTMRKTGILASVIAAQYIIEGASGKSDLAKYSHNHFGMKFFGKTDVPGYVGKVWKKDSGEGKYAWWYVYKDDESSFAHHAQLLQGKRYRHLIGIKTYPEYLTGIKKAGYATAKDYAIILANVIYSRKLYELDYLVFRNYKQEYENAITDNRCRMESENQSKP